MKAFLSLILALVLVVPSYAQGSLKGMSVTDSSGNTITAANPMTGNGTYTSTSDWLPPSWTPTSWTNVSVEVILTVFDCAGGSIVTSLTVTLTAPVAPAIVPTVTYTLPESLGGECGSWTLTVSWFWTIWTVTPVVVFPGDPPVDPIISWQNYSSTGSAGS